MNIMLCPPDPCHHDDCCGDYSHFEPLLSTIGVGPRGPKGDKGDKGDKGEGGETFTFDDLTEEQLADLRREISSVYYKKIEGTYTTTSSSTTRVKIPISGWNDHDILFVDVNGLDLVNGVDYTINNGSIVLTNAITSKGESINFKAFRAIAITSEDYDALKGEKGDPGISGDYAGLINKPSINGNALSGNSSFDDLGLVAMTNSEIDNLFK